MFRLAAIAGIATISAFLTGGAESASVSPPDFAPNPSVGWVAAPGPYIAPPSGPGPVPTLDQRHGSQNAGFIERGTQPIFEMGDPDAPILQPWAKAQVSARNDAIRAGKPGFTRQASCWPNGTPAFLLYPQQPLFFVQTPKMVVLIWQGDHQVRHIYLGGQHSKNPKPSWYGESVGHYENGDTLVIDTIGVTDKTFIDNYRTPHTTQMHVVERWQIVEGGNAVEVSMTVEDPGAFTSAWSATQRWRKVHLAPLTEIICNENSADYMNLYQTPMPSAGTPDF